MSDNRHLLGPTTSFSCARSHELGVTGEVQHTCCFSEQIGSLCVNEDYSDVRLILNGTSLPAHRVILAARISNVCTILSASFLFSLTKLTQHCLEFVDRCALEVLNSEGFMALSSVIKEIISRDSFFVPEIEVFKAVREWARVNPTLDLQEVLSAVRLPLISLENLLNCVRPSGIVSADDILDTIKTQSEKIDSQLKYRGYSIHDVNVAASNRNDVDNPGIVVQLGSPYIINHIKMLLWDRDERSYSYYIETSMDRERWVRVVDYSDYLCRSWQYLYFPERVVRYIKIVGTRNTKNNVFHLVSLEAMYSTRTFKLKDGFVVPNENVSLLKRGASVIEGISCTPDALINGDSEHYDWDSGYTCHPISTGAIIVQLPQPFILDSMRILLWDCDSRKYSYYVETSIDCENWKLLMDKRDEECSSWQHLKFEPRLVIYVKIVGTRNTANEVFHCVHIECPDQTCLPYSSTECINRITRI
ncbi:unnamed protein product [Soboliphyme baturini]|uniref:BACK domain-containing protein n=1 Tax=Soboliphyme baturini TaxID=241478 RepID=A0A183ILR5_9BILA|nr:unnamed protein product [Soboliphyme baturini]